MKELVADQTSEREVRENKVQVNVHISVNTA